MFESFKVYKKESECNLGEWNRVIIDKPYIMEVCASRDFIDKYIKTLIAHGFDWQKFIFSLRNEDLIDDDIVISDSGVNPSNIRSKLTLVCEWPETLDRFVEWLTEMI